MIQTWDLSVKVLLMRLPAVLHNTCDYIADAILLTTQFWILYYIFDTPNNLKWKIVNNKVVDLVENYNFDVDFISIWHC